jgi:glycosyltransferase involved in cell wall biosynthesis
MAHPKISVITPSFNQGDFIAQTFQSIHDQAYPNLEHIVMDGGSTDNTREIIEQYEHAIAFWVSEPDDGQTDALAKGFSMATGDIQCWLNSDDLHHSTTLHEVAQFFEANPDVRFIYGDSEWIDVGGDMIKPKREHAWNSFVWLNDHDFLPQPSCFWRSDLYEQVGGLNTSFDLAMDADLWIRFAQITRPRHVRRVWSSMRFYPSQKNMSQREKSEEETELIRSRYRPQATRPWQTARYAGARSLRVLLKTSAGGYSRAEILSHLPGLFGKGSWEERHSV